jgi:copper oxidase (laccase) domain-containing protein
MISQGKQYFKMISEFGCNSRISGRNRTRISKCCFETGEDVPEAVRKFLGDESDVFPFLKGEKTMVDLKGINGWSLQRAGCYPIISKF